jgi:hypothetical protein
MWKYIPGYENKYKINEDGVIVREAYTYVDTFGCGRHRVMPEHIVKATLGNNGYYMVDLHSDGKRKRYSLHRILAQVFIPNPDGLPFVNHKDEDKTNNNLSNLEWCTCAYNNSYGTNRERMVATRKVNGSYKCSDEQRLKISNALKGVPKSEAHKQHMRGHNNNRYK